MKESVVVTLTSYGKRLSNLPMVLDTIISQTVKPDLIVVNLACDEEVPLHVLDYLAEHNVEVNRVPDTKVYKKLIPTLRKYPDACVISIDDDFLYPKDMISDFVAMHHKYPDNPISGNRVVFFKMQCHCGCASLTKACYFDNYLSQIDGEVIDNCPSDDIVYTYFATKAGHPYLQTEREYFLNMPECRHDNDPGYSNSTGGDLGVERSFDYLVKRFGAINNVIMMYLHDENKAKVIENIMNDTVREVEDRIHSSYAFRLGKALLKPFSWLKNNIGK